MAKIIGYTFLTILGLFALLTVHSYFTYGYGSMTEAEIAESKADLQKTSKICDSQRHLATAIGDKNFDYGACLKRER